MIIPMSWLWEKMFLKTLLLCMYMDGIKFQICWKFLFWCGVIIKNLNPQDKPPLSGRSFTLLYVMFSTELSTVQLKADAKIHKDVFTKKKKAKLALQTRILCLQIIKWIHQWKSKNRFRSTSGCDVTQLYASNKWQKLMQQRRRNSVCLSPVAITC